MAGKTPSKHHYVKLSSAIWKLAYYPPFEILTCLDFRSPLYTNNKPRVGFQIISMLGIQMVQSPNLSG